MRGGRKDSWGKGSSPNLEAALQHDTAMRREEMGGKCWEHWAGCRAHTRLAVAKLEALKILVKESREKLRRKYRRKIQRKS